jgi:AAA family ATP:ADP antiporter
MKRFRAVDRLLRARPGERRRVVGMCLLVALIIATNYVLKPVRSSLFLSDFGAQRLPYVYLILAVILGPAAIALSRFVAWYRVERVLVASALLFAATMLVTWSLIEAGVRYLAFLLYIWVGIVVVVLPSLFWLLANHLFYSNEARRLFTTLTAGGLAGSIVGAALTSVLVRFTGTEGLLLSAAVLFLLVAWLADRLTGAETGRLAERQAERERRETRRVVGRVQNAPTILLRSRYLGLLAALIVVSGLASTLIDYQFNAVAEAAYSRKDDLTRFFGTFFAGINGLALLLQVGLAGSFVGHFGVAAGLLLLPFMLFSGTIGFFFFPRLAAAGLLKFADDGLGNSVNKSSLEILYLPIPLEVKNRTKTFLDVFVERAGRALGGLLILAVLSVFALGLRQLGLVVLLLAIPWMAIALLLQREYVKAFRESIARRDIDLTALTSGVRDPQGLAVLRQVLVGSDEKQILYALELLRGSFDPSLLEPVRALVTHKSAAVRAAALGWLADSPSPPPIEEVDELSEDLSRAVSAEALMLLARTDAERGRAKLTELLESRNVERIEAVLGRLEGFPELLEGVVDLDFVRRYHGSDRENERALAARAIGFLPADEDTRGLLIGLLRDSSPAVARLAAASAAALGEEALTPLLFAQLSRPPLRASARRALVRFGPEVAETALALLSDPQQKAGLKLALPRLLVEFDSQKVLDRLLARLPEGDVRLHHHIVKALGKMRARYPRLHFRHEAVDSLLQQEARGSGELAARRLALTEAPSDPPSHPLLLRALDEQIELARERVFRLLGLLYPARDIYNAWHGIVHGKPAVRAASLEFLDNVFSVRHRNSILPLIEAATPEEICSRSVALFGVVRPDFRTALGALAAGKDTWLAACAVTLVGELGLSGFAEQLSGLGAHPDPLLREAALAARHRAA